MTMVPETSSSLLRAISADSQSVRWNDFVSRYTPMMTGYLMSKYVNIDYEDVIQETFVALAKVLPNYRYDPEETGHFRNYLTAVLRNKACDAIRATQKADALKGKVSSDPTFLKTDVDETKRLRHSIYTIALHQILNDETLLSRNRRIFVESAINGRSASGVAVMFGVARNNVDQIKARILKKLQVRVSELSRIAYDE